MRPLPPDLLDLVDHQHYADFDVQVRAVLGQNYAGEGRFEDAARFLEQLFIDGLRARQS